MANKYKFGEDRIMTKVKHYIDSTYGKHYGSGKFQSTEVIFDAEHGEGFLYRKHNEICSKIWEKKMAKM